MEKQPLLSLLQKSHSQAFAMGWWSDCPKPADPAFKWYIATKLCLIHSEIDEANDIAMDGHLPHRSAFSVEIADTVIRVFDLIGFLKIPEDCEAAPARLQTLSNDRHSFLMALHSHTSAAMEHQRKGKHGLMFSELLALVATVQVLEGRYPTVDIYGAMVEKLAYNAKRSDHKLENRKSGGGKSY